MGNGKREGEGPVEGKGKGYNRKRLEEWKKFMGNSRKGKGKGREFVEVKEQRLGL